MKIHYSPYFERNPFVDFQKRNNLIFNEMIVGNKGLLTELELRSGLVCETLSDVEREASYYQVLKKAVDKHPESFIKKSFEMDEYGVASEVLNWRDELVLAGWNPEIEGVSDKLDLIAEVEKLAVQDSINIKGESDRWKAIFDSDAQFFDEDEELLIYFPEHLLPPYLADFFRKISKKGMQCTYQNEEKSIAEEGTNLQKLQKALLNTNSTENHSFREEDQDSLRILRFEKYDDALEYMVNQEPNSNKVYVNSDNRNFDNLQEVFNNPLSGSFLKNASPEIVQLFKLGLSLFISPLHIYNLVSYLQVSIHPLPSSFRHKLIQVIIEEGGIVNEKWEAEIGNFKNPENAEEADKNKKKLKFLPINTDFSEEIKVPALKEFVTSLRNWAHQRMHSNNHDFDELTIQAFSSLINLCNAFQIILDSQTESNVSPEKLKSWILSIYKPSDYNYTTPQAGSRFVISSPAAILDPAEELIWMDCFEGIPEASKYRFLTQQEFNLLEDNGLKLWSEEDQVKAQLYEQKRAVLQCRTRCTLLVSNKKRGERVSEHPLLTRLHTQFDNIESITAYEPEPAGKIENIKLNRLPETSLAIELDQKNLFITREKESYSSLSNLIQNPLDYIFQYHLGITDPGVNELSNENRTMGNVAHLFIEELVNDSGRDLASMKALVDNEFRSRFDKAVLQKGAVLLLEENKILLTRFEHILNQSVKNLLEIIETNNLEVEGVEVIENCQQDRLFELESRIDLLLKEKRGRPVIFDLKWTSAKTYYNNLVKENRALQLEVYRKVLEKARNVNTSGVGYYNLTRGVLITPQNFRGDHIVSIEPENDKDIFTQAINSYHYRWKQIQEGVIEVAEGLELNQLDYVNESDNKNLYPLDSDYNDKKLKATNKFSNFQTFKGGLK
jgi:hypothetical protein